MNLTVSQIHITYSWESPQDKYKFCLDNPIDSTLTLIYKGEI